METVTKYLEFATASLAFLSLVVAGVVSIWRKLREELSPRGIVGLCFMVLSVASLAMVYIFYFGWKDHSATILAATLWITFHSVAFAIIPGSASRLDVAAFVAPMLMFVLWVNR